VQPAIERENWLLTKNEKVKRLNHVDKILVMPRVRIHAKGCQAKPVMKA
jgi:hypothetical protein